MKVTYNQEEDTLRILFSEAAIQESEQHPNGLILDFGREGRIIGMELIAASEHLSRPYTVNLVDRSSAADTILTKKDTE